MIRRTVPPHSDHMHHAQIDDASREQQREFGTRAGSRIRVDVIASREHGCATPCGSDCARGIYEKDRARVEATLLGQIHTASA